MNNDCEEAVVKSGRVQQRLSSCQQVGSFECKFGSAMRSEFMGTSGWISALLVTATSFSIFKVLQKDFDIVMNA